MNRRGFLRAGGAALTAASGYAWWRLWPREGVWNPCLGPLPRRLAEHELVRAAWEGIEPANVWDSHAHLVGVGDSPSGIEVSPRLGSLLHPVDFARKTFFLDAACAHGPGIDAAYLGRLRQLVSALRPGTKILLFAFDRAYDEHGAMLPEHTDFYIPDAYARDVARRDPDLFEWVASVHPYRADCVQALEEAKRSGARAIKWLPSAMGIDPASSACDRFYAAAASLGLPLISHAGLERAIAGADEQSWGNPLKLRRALDAGVRVVVAHCASMGEDRDLDKGRNGPHVECFELFARMMAEHRYEGRLFGDLSAVTQTARSRWLGRLLQEEQWHARLLNGSDYPLPGLMPLFSMDGLVSLGVLEPAMAPVLAEVRRHNPLLFDFVAKRSLKAAGRRLPARVFETRAFFDPLRSSTERNIR